ncbi:MAG: hypothetical protein QXF82_09165 [Nitrososphaeria archaeon]
MTKNCRKYNYYVGSLGGNSYDAGLISIPGNSSTDYFPALNAAARLIEEKRRNYLEFL